MGDPNTQALSIALQFEVKSTDLKDFVSDFGTQSQDLFTQLENASGKAFGGMLKSVDQLNQDTTQMVHNWRELSMTAEAQIAANRLIGVGYDGILDNLLQAQIAIKDLVGDSKKWADVLPESQNDIMEIHDSLIKIRREYNGIAGVMKDTIEKWEDGLEQANLEIEASRLLNRGFEEQLRILSDIQTEIEKNIENTDLWGKMLPEQQKRLLEMHRTITGIQEGQRNNVNYAREFANCLSGMGIEGMGGLVRTLSSAGGMLLVLTSQLGAYLNMQSDWREQNYTIYGGLQQINDAVIDIQRSSFLTGEAAHKAAKALMEAAVTKDAMTELGHAIGDLAVETGISDVAAARYAKRLQSLGYTSKNIVDQFLSIKKSMAAWALTGREAEGTLNHLTENAASLQARLGQQGFVKYAQEMVKIQAVAKSTGTSLTIVGEIYKNLETDALRYYLLIGKGALTEADANKNFQTMLGNTGKAMKQLARIPPGVRDQVAREMYGMSYESIAQLDNMQKEIVKTGKSLDQLTPEDVSKKFEEMRRATDPIYSLRVAIEDIGRALLVILKPIIWLVEGLGWLAAKFNMLPSPIKTVIGLVLFFGMASLLAGGRLSLLLAPLQLVGGLFRGVGAAAASGGAALGQAGGGIAAFGNALSAINPLPILALGAALLMVAAAMWILSQTFTSVGKTIGVIVGLGVAIGAFAAMMWVAGMAMAAFGAVLAPAAPIILAVAAVFLILAAAIWLLSKGFDVFVHALGELAKIDLVKLGVDLIQSSTLILLGVTVLLAAAIIGASIAPFAILASLAFISLGLGLFLLTQAVNSGGIEKLPQFGLQLTLGMISIIGALLFASSLLPLALLASVTFIVLGASLYLFALAISRDISGAPAFSLQLSGAMLALIPALLLAGTIMPLAVLASITFLTLGVSIGLFADALKRDISGAAGFSLQLIGALYILSPALLLAALMSPLAVLASITFLTLGLTMGLFANVLKKDISGAPEFAGALTLAMIVLTVPLVMAAALTPLALLAMVAFTVIAATLWIIVGTLKSLADGVELLPVVANSFAAAMRGIANGMWAAVRSPYARFIVAASAMVIGLVIVLGMFVAMAVAIALLPIIAASFGAAMLALGQGMSGLIAAPYLRFMGAASSAAAGLGSILYAFVANAAGIKQLPTIAGSFQNAMWEINKGMNGIIQSDHKKFQGAAGSVAQGIGMLFSSITPHAAMIDKLPVVAAALKSLMDLSNNATGGQAIIDMASSVNIAIMTLGDSLATYASYVETAADRICGALDRIEAHGGTLASSDITQIVKNDAVISVKTDVGEASTKAEQTKNLAEKLDGVQELLRKLIEITGSQTDDEEFKSKLYDLLMQYLPQIAEGQESGLASVVNKWGGSV